MEIRGYALPELPKAPEALERAVIRDGLCRTHPHPEWWTTSDQSDIIPVRYERMTTSHGRPYRQLSWHNSTPRWRAKRICQECPVRKKCRDLADIIEAQAYGNGLRGNAIGGVWGGEGPQDRVNRRNEEAIRRAA